MKKGDVGVHDGEEHGDGDFDGEMSGDGRRHQEQV